MFAEGLVKEVVEKAVEEVGEMAGEVEEADRMVGGVEDVAREVEGVVFQYSAEAVVFEFSREGGEVEIGMVKPSGLRVGARWGEGDTKYENYLS